MNLGIRLLWRDWRGGELGVLAGSLVIAVAIVTGISLFTDRLKQEIASQSSNFLAADRVLTSPRPIDPSWLSQAQKLGLRQAQTLSFQTMVFSVEEMQLTSVKAVSSSYPLLGLIEVTNQPFTPGVKLDRGPALGEVWADHRLLDLLNITLGGELSIGEATFRVSRILLNEPDKGASTYSFGTRLLMNLGDIPATETVKPSSRVEYRFLFAGDTVSLKRFSDWLEPQLQPSHRWLALKDSQPRIAQAIVRAERFLLLAGSMGVGLAGIAIALAARRYSERHYDYVAMMKSLGSSGRRIMAIYTANLLFLAVISTVLGWLLGWCIQAAFIYFFNDLLAAHNSFISSYRPFGVGAITAFVCVFSFALPPLISLQKISPLRVLRRDMGDDAINHILTYSAGVLGIVGLMFWYSGDLKLTLSVFVGVALTVCVVGFFGFYLLRGTGLIGMQAGGAVQLAFASMRRRGLQNSVQLVIFSLAIMLLLVLALLRSSLVEEWQKQLPEGTPNHFFLNISKDEVDEVKTLLRRDGVVSQTIYPIVRGRLTLINGRAVTSAISKDEGVARSIDRELSLTWSSEIPAGNFITAGHWWPADQQNDWVSVESELAVKLGINLKDSLTFQVGDRSLTVIVSSIRELDWNTMQPNFYMIFPPTTLQGLPTNYLTSFYLPTEKKLLLNQFLRDFPTITVIEVDAVIKQIRSIITQVSAAIELVLLLIIISGVMVLIAAVQASLDSRFQESAILRTLGARRGLVMGSLVVEFMSLGALAGLLAAGAAELSIYTLQSLVLNMPFVGHVWVWLVGPAMGAILIGFVGFMACRKVVNTPPIQVLREL